MASSAAIVGASGTPFSAFGASAVGVRVLPVRGAIVNHSIDMGRLNGRPPFPVRLGPSIRGNSIYRMPAQQNGSRELRYSIPVINGSVRITRTPDGKPYSGEPFKVHRMAF